jgi:hypothetical protein
VINAQTHIHVISCSLQVLREIVQLPEQDEFSLMRALAHMQAINDSSRWLKEWADGREFIRKVTA